MKPSWLLDIDGVISPYTLGLTTRLPLHIHKDWITEKVVDSKGKEFKVQVARRVVDFINDVHADDLVNIIWHTTWQHDANEISRIFGLPEFPVLDAPEFETWNRRTARGWWKQAPAQRHLDSTTAPTLWTDDDLNMGWADKMSSPHGLKIIAPNQHTGLTPKHLADIGNFLMFENGVEEA